MVPFLEGDYTPDQLKADLAAREAPTPEGEGEVEREAVLLEEVQKTVDAKQLKPMVRTQYMRTAFQVGWPGGGRWAWGVGCTAAYTCTCI